ncbi:MAG: pentapeptide repeat-containing protein [Acidimicrobiia bacterium]
MTVSGALPPGQIETRRFPVVGERSPSSELSANGWSLTIGGLVAEELTLDFGAYADLEHRELAFDVHCVTSWTRFESRWKGLPIRDLLDPLPEGRFVSFSAYSDRNHHTSLPMDLALEESWLVHEFDGSPLESEHGGPVRVVTPGRYFYKSLKWVRAIDVLAEDRLGWWEINSFYHNNGDPWTGDQRFTTGSLRPDQLTRFLDSDRYDKYRGRVLLGLDLRGWTPATADLRRLYLKNCRLDGLDLTGADLRGSNLSLSSLRGAVLTEADLSGSDLEGADFGGANLTGANLSGTALSATRFDGSLVTGARFQGAWGLVEEQYEYLAAQGVLG